jgi:hypothetical protein
MYRSVYFQRIKEIDSPLLTFPELVNNAIRERTNCLTEPINAHLELAEKLSQLDNNEARTRAKFIRLQCGGIDAEDFFETHRESWGIPKFQENLVTVDDFRNGFLWKFRDHTTSWSEDMEAREWFSTHIEARFVRHYEFWTCDDGPEKMLYSNNGDYKTILLRLVKIYQDYSVLISPVFTKSELSEVYNNHDPEDTGFEKEDLLEIVSQNPNW